jgi:hypothetical protein
MEIPALGQVILPKATWLLVQKPVILMCVGCIIHYFIQRNRIEPFHCLQMDDDVSRLPVKKRPV